MSQNEPDDWDFFDQPPVRRPESPDSYQRSRDGLFRTVEGFPIWKNIHRAAAVVLVALAGLIAFLVLTFTGGSSDRNTATPSSPVSAFTPPAGTQTTASSDAVCPMPELGFTRVCIGAEPGASGLVSINGAEGEEAYGDSGIAWARQYVTGLPGVPTNLDVRLDSPTGSPVSAHVWGYTDGDDYFDLNVGDAAQHHLVITYPTVTTYLTTAPSPTPSLRPATPAPDSTAKTWEECQQEFVDSGLDGTFDAPAGCEDFGFSAGSSGQISQ